MSSRGVSVDFDWHDYLTLARELYSQSNNYPNLVEACLRSAISRAYFAAYCLARNYLCDKENFVPPKKDTHSKIINEFNVKNNSSKQKLFMHLTRLRQDRNKADYNNSVNNLKSLTESVLVSVTKTIEIIDSL